jgi:hypothetical protein
MLKLFQWILSWMLVMSLAACGGGGGSSGDSIFDGGDGTTSTVKISLSLSDTTVSSASPVTVTAKVTKSSSALSGKVVKFSVEDGLGELSASSALTDSNGEASVTLSPADSTVGGADIVTASVTVDDTTATASQGFQLTATEVGLVSVSPATGNGTSAAKPVGAYGQTVLTVALEGVSDDTPATVSLASSCTAASKASISPTSTTTTSNTITFVYTDAGCGSLLEKDIVTATLSGSGKTTQGYVYLEAPASRSLAFDSDSLSVSQIYLKGSGLVEAASVAFLVNDQAGNPLSGKKVDLTLTTYVGGITLDGKGKGTTITKTTDSDGRVSAIVNAGSVPTPVRVKAVLHDDTSTSAVSSILSIGVGLPTQSRFAFAAVTFNSEGYNETDTEVSLTVSASDRSGNQIPAGTAINFWSEEGGSVPASATTDIVNGQGVASVKFSSLPPSIRDKWDGRVTVLAYAIGEESFFDANGNNIYDSGELFQDLGDLVKDVKLNGVYNPSEDEFIPFGGGTQTCVSGHGDYTANMVNKPATCDGAWSFKNVYVRRALELVMSTSNSRLLWGGSELSHFEADSKTCKSNLKLQTGSAASTKQRFIPFIGSGEVYYTSGAFEGSILITVADANPVRLNPMPKGTTLSVSDVSDGLTVKVLSGSVINTSEATSDVINYSFEDTETAKQTGKFTLKTLSPNGVETLYTITINTREPETPCQ